MSDKAYVLRKVLQSEDTYEAGRWLRLYRLECGHEKAVSPVPDKASVRARCPDCLRHGRTGPLSSPIPSAVPESENPPPTLRSGGMARVPAFSYLASPGMWRAECPVLGQEFIAHGDCQDQAEERLRNMVIKRSPVVPARGLRAFDLVVKDVR